MTHQDWSAYTTRVVWADESDFVPTVRDHSAAGAAYVDAMHTAVGEHEMDLPTDDLVHGNLDPGNVVFRDGAVASVTVWGEADAAPVLVEASDRCIGRRGTRVCVAASCVAILAFGVQHWAHDVDAVAGPWAALLRDLA